MAKKPADSESGASSDATSGSEMTSQSGATSDSSAASSDATSESGTEDMPQKGKTGKQALVERKPSGKQSARPARLSAAVAAATAKPRGSGHELIPVLCSECYEEFIFDSGVAAKVLTCPVCEHQAARPDDALLHKINDLRSAEKIGFMMSVGLTGFGFFFMVVWAMLGKNPHNHDGAAFWAPLAIGLLAMIGGGVAGAMKYEAARHETYF
jgi:hypothetical protein